MKKKTLLIFSVLILLLSSCASMLGRELNAPMWYFRPQSRANKSQIAFIGVGKAANERQALLLAYSDINDRLYAYIGEEPSAERYRELTRSGKITDYDFEVIEEYQSQENNQYTVYLLGMGKKQTLNKFRTDDVLKESETASKAQQLILEGDELIKSNQDILGVKKYIKSMVLTYPLSQIDDEYSFASIMNEILSILSTTSMTTVDSDTDKANCTISVKRKSALIPSKVINVPVKASYKAIDSKGKEYNDSFVFSSDDSGMLSFSPKNYAIAKTGSVVFEFDLDSELKELAKVSESAAKIIGDTAKGKSIIFDYNVNYGNTKIALSSFEYSVDGYYGKSDLVNSYLTSRFDSDDIAYYVSDEMSDEDDESILKSIYGKSPDCDFVLISRVGYSDYAESKTGTIAVTSEGLIRLYDLRMGELVYESNHVYSNGFGDTAEKALQDSYSNFAEIIYSILKAFYV